ncbi:glycosyltransferase [Vibrio kanaloae]|uniref:glycosyltransferase family 2 protein n=1 Tax=Vibrio kanaloae TaxID=170673 RepID=UPI0035A699B8
MEKNDIKVSVCVVTYNQKDYISECIESIISQEANFKYEVIIGDDCSTDGTRDLIVSYQKKYPDLIRPILRKENVGVVRNLAELYMSARGDYIAHIDGDDVMMPNKLATQFEILESNLDCYICSHDMVKINSISETVGYSKKVSLPNNISLPDLYRNLPFFAHSSKMFRNDLSDHEFYKYLDKDTADFELHLYHANKGDIYHIPEHLGKYRVGVGVSIGEHRINPILPMRKSVLFEALLKDKMVNMENNEIKVIYSQCMCNYAKGSFYFGNISDFKKYILKSKNISVFSFEQIIYLVLSMFPSKVILFFRMLFLKLTKNNN